MNTLELISSDCYRYKGKADLNTMAKFYISDPVFRWHVAFRMSKADGITGFIGLVLWKINRYKRRIIIPKRTQIGYGLYLAHGGPVVINPTTKIGNNCNISQFVTIGSNYFHAASIGDCVYIGPNACIIEDVCIGNNVTVGAGGIVTKNIPDNATVVGNYAKIINYDHAGEYIQNKYIPKIEQEKNNV